MGKAIPDALLRMWEFLPDDIQDSLLIAVEKNRDANRNFRGASVSPCPHCGDPNTMDCSTINAIGEATVGLCLVCGYLWCLECDSSLITGINCGHWQICSSCPEKKQSTGYCGTVPWECRHIREWLRRNHPVV